MQKGARLLIGLAKFIRENNRQQREVKRLQREIVRLIDRQTSTI